MTGKERIGRILAHKKTDRVGLYEHFWTDTRKAWIEEGHIDGDTDLGDLFGHDMEECWAFNLVADIDFVPEVVHETENTITMLDGNGATLKKHKKHEATPEHMGYRVTCREDWEKHIKPLLTPDARRINFEAYRDARLKAQQAGRYFVWSGVNVFESIHPMCGHVNMLMGMVDDPQWVADMANTYAQLTVDLQKILFEQEGYPDGLWFYEDMGFKGSPFMSPRMYQDLIQPAHRYTIEYGHRLGMKVIMHSCGYVEPLLPHMIEAGIDCLQVIEVKAGMDLLKLNRLYGDKIAFMGGLDVRALYSNDRAIIDAELEAKLPPMMERYNYVVHSDHSIPKTVHYDTYRYFVDKALELGTYG